MLHFALRSITSNQSWQMIPLYKAIIESGHEATFYVNTDKITTVIPLNIENIPWEPEELIDQDDPPLYDVIIERTPHLSGIALKPTGISIGFFCGGVGGWLAIADSLSCISKHNLWIGHHCFELASRLEEGFDGEFPLIGMPSLSSFYSPSMEALTPDFFHPRRRAGKLTGLYFNGCPFKEENKQRFNAFIIQMAKRHPDVTFLLKERFMKVDEGSHYHLTQLSDSGCPNIVIKDAMTSSTELVKEADFLFGLSTTSFIEALYLQKPVLIVDDFDTEYHLGVKASEIYWQFELGMTRTTSKAMIEDLYNVYEKSAVLPQSSYSLVFPFPNPCAMIVKIAELILETAQGRQISQINFNREFGNLVHYKKEVQAIIAAYDQDPQKLISQRKEEILYYMILEKALIRIKYILPYLPQAIFQQFVQEIKQDILLHMENDAFLVNTFEHIGEIFYAFLGKAVESGLNGSFPPTLFLRSSRLLILPKHLSSQYLELRRRRMNAFKR